METAKEKGSRQFLTQLKSFQHTDAAVTYFEHFVQIHFSLVIKKKNSQVKKQEEVVTTAYGGCRTMRIVVHCFRALINWPIRKREREKERTYDDDDQANKETYSDHLQ